MPAHLLQNFTLQLHRENFTDLDRLKRSDESLPFKWLSRTFRGVACESLCSTREYLTLFTPTIPPHLTSTVS